MKTHNVFTTYLQLLDVKYTSSFSDTYFNEHPHKNNLYGISRMLSDYGIENTGLKMENKKDIFELEAPFIAHVSTDFVVVYKITPEQIQYIGDGKHTTVSLNDFFNVWTGVVLIAEDDTNAIEPDYKANKLSEWLIKGQKALLGSAVAFLLVYSFFLSGIYKDIYGLLLLALNIAGVYIGYLLILKQLNRQSRYSDKICSLFKQSDCNDILQSDAARLWGVIGWSEVGLGYFLANVVILLLFPSLWSHVAIINIGSLPFTVWSVWYQRVKAKQWCPLCLCALAVLWLIFLVNVFSGSLYFPSIMLEYLVVGCIYLLFIITLNLLVPRLALAEKTENITQELSSLKSKEEVFYSLLQVQAYYPISKDTSQILFGNKEAKNLITVITNPHCEPCAKMHARVDKLLKKGGEKVCIQYLFLSFPDLEESNLFLIGTYLKMNTKESMKVYTEWFNQGGKNQKESFFKRYPLNLNENDTRKEYEAHREWGINSGINSTPTILVNGYLLPPFYKIEDLMEVI